LRNTVFLFLLTGFGTKAGVVPLMCGSPTPHPQAPSHVSSIMSGGNDKKPPFYGIIRFIMIILGPGPEWWGGLILALAFRILPDRCHIRVGGT